MTMPGQYTARPPRSPHATLTALARVGTQRGGSAIWRVACSCGLEFDAAAPAIRYGQAKCARCQPALGDIQAMEILMLLPANYRTLAQKLGVHLCTAKTRVRAMQKNALCHKGKWKRSNGPGGFQPIIVSGPGEDVPCTLATLTNADHKRKYRKRIKHAIARTELGGKEDPRYMRHIALSKAHQTARKTRGQPETWCSALMLSSQSAVR